MTEIARMRFMSSQKPSERGMLLLRDDGTIQVQPTEELRDEMARLLGVAADRIDVVPLAPSAVFRPASATDAAEVLCRYGLRDRGFVLSVSTLEPRKNLDGLLAAWRALPEAVRTRAPRPARHLARPRPPPGPALRPPPAARP